MKQTVYGLLIPFLGTTLGTACVFFMRKQLSDAIQRILTGFAAGVMVAASVWSLLIPAMEQAAWMGKLAFLPAFSGFWIGILSLLGLDHLIPHLHAKSNQAEGPKSQLKKTTMMVLAVTLHNIPEGMAVGVVYAGVLSGSAQITATGALALSIGIAIQNFPEGAIISLPLRAEGEQGTGVSWRCALRHCGADRGRTDHPLRTAGRTCASVSAELCRRSDALCGGGGADPGNVPRQAFQPWHACLCGGLQHHDGTGCGAGINHNKTSVMRGENKREIF